MTKPYVLIAAFLILNCGISAFGQTGAKSKQIFSSVLTDLNKDCKSTSNAEAKNVETAQKSNPVLKCKAVGNYFLYINKSASASTLYVGYKRDDSSIQLATQNLNYQAENNKSVEWRLANGKPFAVIVHVSKYKFPNEIPAGTTPFDARYKIGESLIVRGLLGFEQIEYDFDAKLSDSVEQARKIADEAFAGR